MPKLENILWPLRLIAAASVALVAPALAEPAGGPLPGGDVARDARPAEDDERHRRYADAVNARDLADRLRAAYEEAHKGGGIPDDAAAAEFEEVVRAYEEAIDRDATDDDDDDDVAPVVAYCRLRLAGAYQYAGRHGRAVEVAKEAADRATAGSPDEIEACLTVGLVYLQAVHAPADALPWLKRAQSLAAAVTDAAAAAKWTTATANAVRRCEQQLKDQKK